MGISAREIDAGASLPVTVTNVDGFVRDANSIVGHTRKPEDGIAAITRRLSDTCESATCVFPRRLGSDPRCLNESHFLNVRAAPARTCVGCFTSSSVRPLYSGIGGAGSFRRSHLFHSFGQSLPVVAHHADLTRSGYDLRESVPLFLLRNFAFESVKTLRTDPLIGERRISVKNAFAAFSVFFDGDLIPELTRS